MIKLKTLQQPTPYSCAHTCLAMVTGESIDGLIERFGDRGLGFSEKACVLVEHGIFPVKTSGQVCEFPHAGLYFVSTPSLNLPGHLHLVVVVANEDGYTVYDPNSGRDGVKSHAPDALMSKGIARCDVIYLDTRILSDIQGVESAEVKQLKGKLEEAQDHLQRYSKMADALSEKDQPGMKARIAKHTAYEIRDWMVRVLDREFDSRAQEIIEDIASDYSAQAHQEKEPAS